MRKYEFKRRAEQVEETRRRITAATVELHEEVGPARTTVAGIAARAGVTRPTVYSQFPDELSLFTACSAHFQSLHPPPELLGLELEAALRAQYAYFRENERMLAHVVRDAETLPALAQVTSELDAYIGRVVRELVRALDFHAARRTRAAALVALALDFHTWRSLHRSGLGQAEAAALMAQLVRVA